MGQLTVISVILSLILVGSSNCVDKIGDREVRYMGIPQNWFTAYEICRAEGMQLMTIYNETENQMFIQLAESYKPNTAFWIGATDLGHEGEFVWMATGLKVTNGWWYPGQPDNSKANEHCVHITYDWGAPKWNDVQCIYKYPFFCEEQARALLPPTNFCTSVYRC